MKLSLRCLLFCLGFHFYPACTQMLPQARLTVEPQNPVFTGETVKLTCLVRSYIGWRYKWFKRNTGAELAPSGRYSKSENVFTIRGAAGEDNALYWCQGESSTGYLQSHISNAVQLAVTALPRATLTVQPHPPVFTGETVTLKCAIESHSGWTYKWYMGSSTNPAFQSEGNSFIISGLKESHAGQCWCQGQWKHRPLSIHSNTIHLRVQALPASTVVLQNPQSLFYAGDIMSLRCDLADYTDWGRYSWYRDRSLIPNMTSKAVAVTLLAQAGQNQFTCEGERNSRPKRSQVSTAIEITALAQRVETASQPSNNITHGGQDESLASTLSVSRMVCSLLVVSPYLFVSVILGVQCHRYRGANYRHSNRKHGRLKPYV
ncbi:Fc receptor-like protein 5 [Alosa sapidissima]|uniref:Fc receptor-like protein 5 n=1 Tax=Alosa sapidissima TaxID=34773 RepID=UPI001C094185|nr:Fc receptor-like protein 5 [Alosa sapidissima]